MTTVARFGMVAFFPFAFSSYSIMDVSQPQCTSVIVKSHPAPWPLDLQTTITLQHLQLPSWLIPLLWVSALSEPHQTDQPVALSLDLDPLPALCSADDPLDWLFASV